jgi:hypothetical protein
MMGILSEDDNIENACKSKVTYELLDKAKKWLISWIENPNTKQRWMTKNKKTSQEWDETKKSAVDLVNGVKNISFITSKATKRNVTLFYVLAGNTTTIFAVCDNIIKQNDEKQVYAELVHEIVHIIDSEVELINYEDIYKDFMVDPNEGSGFIFGKQPDYLARIENSIKLLEKEGFDKETLDYYYTEILDGVDNGVSKDPQEIVANIYGIRQLLNKTSGENITVDDIKKISKEYKNSVVYWFMNYIIQSGKSAQEILNSVNSYAVNNTNPNQPKVA